MYQYDDPTVTAVLPASTAAGTAGYFTDGSPSGGQAATILKAEFMNMLMMELVNLVDAAGIAPSKSDRTQVLQAVTEIAEAQAQLQTPSIAGTFKNLAVSATGASATVTVTADGIALETADSQYKTVRSINLSISGATSGANGLDTGSLAGSTWYSVWVIHNGTTTAGLISLSATSPTLPSGYTYKARIGWIRTDGTANKYPLAFQQVGSQVRYMVDSGSNVTGYPLMASGAQGSVGTPTWVAVGVSNFVPSTASFIHMVSVDSLGGETILSTNGQHGTYTNSANVPPYASDAGTAGYGGSQASLLLESTNIYRAASGGHLVCTGWEDSI